jgi:hypothetical protein
MLRIFRLRWQKAEAKLVDQRLVRRGSYNVHRSDSSYQVWEYMVEVPGADGAPTRLAFEEKSFEVILPPVGRTVPVLVNRARTKAMFDLDDPRISRRARDKRRSKARATRDQDAWDDKLKG